MDYWKVGLSAAAYVAHEMTPLAAHSSLITAEDYLQLVSTALQRILPGEAVSWNGVDLVNGSIAVAAFPSEQWNNNAAAQQLANVMDDHPMARSYFADLSDTTPRRISDIVTRTEFLNSRAYAELYRPIMSADAQLTIVSRAGTTGQLHCWAVNRNGNDFTDNEMEIAAAFQTTLSALEHLVFALADLESAARQPAAQSPNTSHARSAAADGGPGLTPRELEVLAALSTGLTADAIGRMLRISAGTVRKHLDHIYAKLGCHDRMLVVQRAADLGLMPREVVPRFPLSRSDR